MWKILKRPHDLLAFLTGLSSIDRPFFLHFESTYRCNLKCGFCNVWRNNPYLHEASTETFKGRLSEAWSLGCRLVSFTGGEPLMRRDIGELVHHSLSLGYYVGLVTNGVLLDKHLDDLRNIDFLAVSFSYDRVAFNRSRGTRLFCRIRNNIVEAADGGLNPVLFCTLDDETTPHIDETIQFAKDNELEIHFNLVSPLPREGFDEVNWGKFRQKNDGILSHLRDAKRAYPRIKYEEQFLSRKKGYTINDYVQCQAPITTVSLKPDGSVSLPCLLQTMLNSGSQPLRKFWTSEKAQKIKKNAGKYPFCKGCNVSCMYGASLRGHPLEALRWMREML